MTATSAEIGGCPKSGADPQHRLFQFNLEGPVLQAHEKLSWAQFFALVGEEYRAVGGIAGVEFGFGERDRRSRRGGFEALASLWHGCLTALLVAVVGADMLVPVDRLFVGGL